APDRTANESAHKATYIVKTSRKSRHLLVRPALSRLTVSDTKPGNSRRGQVDSESTIADRSRLPSRHAHLAWLIGCHTVAFCISVASVSSIYPEYHLIINRPGLPLAITVATAFATVSVLFIVADFSFGFFVGFYFYTM